MRYSHNARRGQPRTRVGTVHKKTRRKVHRGGSWEGGGGGGGGSAALKRHPLSRASARAKPRKSAYNIQPEIWEIPTMAL